MCCVKTILNTSPSHRCWVGLIAWNNLDWLLQPCYKCQWPWHCLSEDLQSFISFRTHFCFKTTDVVYSGHLTVLATITNVVMTSQMRYFAEQVILAEIMHSHNRTFFLYTHRFIFYACINQFFMYKSDNMDFPHFSVKGGMLSWWNSRSYCFLYNPYGAPIQTLRSKIGRGI